MDWTQPIPTSDQALQELHVGSARLTALPESIGRPAAGGAWEGVGGVGHVRLADVNIGRASFETSRISHRLEFWMVDFVSLAV